MARANRDSYDAIAQEWDGARTCLSAAEARIFNRISEPIARGSRLLDLGCGTGRPVAEHFANLGVRVTGVDQSALMLERAQRRLPDHTGIHSSIEDFESEGIYAAAVAWDSPWLKKRP